jgi:hypothetical protein
MKAPEVGEDFFFGNVAWAWKLDQLRAW